MPAVRTSAGGAAPAASGGNGAALAVSWLFVGIPLAWGVYNTLLNAAKLFH